MNKDKRNMPQYIPSPLGRAREELRLKICGMKYQDNMTQVAALQPDYLGFIFYNKSVRNFDTHIPELSDSIKKTGVFINDNLNVVIEKVNRYNLQAIQLHGHESPEYCNDLKSCYAELVSASHQEDLKQFQISNTLEIIKVFSIKDEFDFSVLKPYEDFVDYFLFDTIGKLPGGNGYTFDWSVLNNYPSTKPFFLSGGIGINQIEDIKTFLKSEASTYCYALDVNSKFEIEYGLKNIDDLKVFKERLSFRT